MQSVIFKWYSQFESTEMGAFRNALRVLNLSPVGNPASLFEIFFQSLKQKKTIKF